MSGAEIWTLRAIYAAWLGWAALWVALAARSKRVARQEPAWSRVAHLAPLGVAVLLLSLPGLLPAPLVHHLLPRAAWMAPLGAVLVAAGLCFAIWARLILAGNWSGTVTVKQGHELVVTGPYRVTRHPIYTGLILAFCGTAVAIDAPRAWLAAALVAISFDRKRRIEERYMREEFGAAYDAYAGRVRAIVPGMY